MQPHSMCTIALANYLWNSSEVLPFNACTGRVWYRNKDHEYKSNVYRLYNILIDQHKTEIQVSIQRDGGGLACTMFATRPSSSEGTLVTQIHDTKHIHGLREEYRLWKNKVASGTHVNSGRYRNFEGDLKDYDRRKMTLSCEIKQDSGYYFWSRYDLELESFKNG